MKAWITAARLRTLPLAASSIIMGSGMASHSGQFKLEVFLLSLLTTVLLQILSNFANDYGDSLNGADHAGRIGPGRMVQTGAISGPEMFRAIAVTAVLSLFSGIALLWVAFEEVFSFSFLTMLFLGLLSIAAAIRYTAGSKPYGYVGLGDLSVLIFFGWVGVGGSYFLHTLTFDPAIILPATATGLVATGVLNLNNIRDTESDRIAGKRSIPVRIGFPSAAHYHAALLIAALLCLLCFLWTEHVMKAQSLAALFPSLALWLMNIQAVYRIGPKPTLDQYLKPLAISSLLLSILLSLALYLK